MKTTNSRFQAILLLEGLNLMPNAVSSEKTLGFKHEGLDINRYDSCIIDMYCKANDLTYYDEQRSETGEFVPSQTNYLWRSKATFQCQLGQKFVDANVEFDNQTIQCLWGSTWSQPLMQCQCMLFYDILFGYRAK